jgi:hypothetical protein
MFSKISFAALFVLISLSAAFAAPFDDAIGKINQLQDEGRKLTDQELIEILTPIARSTESPEESKREQMNSVISSLSILVGRDLSKERIKVDHLLREAQRQRRTAYIQAHPDLGPKTKEAIFRGKVLVGMTPEQAQASWGVPDRKHTTVGSSKNKERWSYFGRVFLSFEGDRLIRLESLE